MVTEDYVNFETAKLLKEKGFEQMSDWGYREDGTCVEMIDNPINPPVYWGVTLQMAMKWLRENHNIDISVVPHSHEKGKAVEYEFVYWNGGEYHVPYDEKHPTYHELFGKTWKKYEEAAETAIKYCLVNFI